MAETARTRAQEAGHTDVAEFLEGYEHRVLSRDVRADSVQLDSNKKTRGEFRKGNWSCPRCSASVFAKSKECYKCFTPKPAGIVEEEEEELDGVSPWGKHLLYEMRQLQDAESS
jgi:ribosomal protein S27AE